MIAYARVTPSATNDPRRRSEQRSSSTAAPRPASPLLANLETCRVIGGPGPSAVSAGFYFGVNSGAAPGADAATRRRLPIASLVPASKRPALIAARVASQLVTRVGRTQSLLHAGVHSSAVALTQGFDRALLAVAGLAVAGAILAALLIPLARQRRALCLDRRRGWGFSERVHAL